MTQTVAETTESTPPARTPQPSPAWRTRRSLAIVAVTALVAATAATVFAVARGGGSDAQTADLNGQGSPDEVLHEDAATLSRRPDGLFATIDIPTPAPASYEYPSSDQVPPGFDPHPQVATGASDAPEVFTAWLFVFNFPELCTDRQCDADDVGADVPAEGGVFQVDGRIADRERLELRGGVRTGAVAVNGVRLEQPITAEVHIAIAAHGRALPGEDGWRQLNEPVGNPDFWWAATFPP